MKPSHFGMDGDGRVDRVTQLRWLAGFLAVAIAFVAVLIASAGSGRKDGTQPQLSRGERAQARVERLEANAFHCPGPGGQTSFLRARGARIISGSAPAYGGEPIARTVNTWAVRTHRVHRAIEAGAADGGETTGALVESHYRACAEVGWDSAQGVELIELAGTGALEIVDGPQGRGVGGNEGSLRFTGTQGVSGTIDLEDLAITCDPPCRVIRAEECEDAGFVGEDGYSGGTVTRVWDLSCEEAMSFGRAALANQCRWSCSYASFRCHDTGGEGGGSLPVACQDGPRRIDITWYGF